MRMRVLTIVAILALSAVHVSGDERTVISYRDVPVHIQTPVAPQPVRGRDDRWYVVYDLYFTNLSDIDFTIDHIVIHDGTSEAAVKTLGRQELADPWTLESPLLFRGERPKTWGPGVIPAGRTAGLFLWLQFASGSEIPRLLSHDIMFAASDAIRVESRDRMSIRSYVVHVNRRAPVVIGPPLRGGGWLCANGPAYNTAHQVVVAVGGVARVPQRFAIDFKKVNASGDVLPNPFPDEIRNAMFFGYDESVLAVADGIVAKVVDGMPDNVPQVSGEIIPSVAITRETVSGNWVALDIGGSRYAYYAHLKPGSISVKAGDRVRRGQVLARLGNSGNSVGPHLHFQLGDRLGQTLNATEGVSFVFDRFEYVGGSGGAAANATATKSATEWRKIPLNGDVIRFE